jgi:hypothetical protein
MVVDPIRFVKVVEKGFRGAGRAPRRFAPRACGVATVTRVRIPRAADKIDPAARFC